MSNFSRQSLILSALVTLILGLVLGLVLHSYGPTKTALARVVPFLDPGSNPMLQDIRANIPRAEVVSVSANQIEVKTADGRQSKFNISSDAHATDISNIAKPIQVDISQIKTGNVVSLQLQQQGFEYQVVYIMVSPPAPAAQ